MRCAKSRTKQKPSAVLDMATLPSLSRRTSLRLTEYLLGRAGLKPLKSDLVRPARIAECPAQLEAELIGVYEMMQDTDTKGFIALEVKVLRTHVHEEIRMQGQKNRSDPDKWRPMIMSFQELYGLKGEKVNKSVLAKIGEEEYRGFSNAADVEDVEWILTAHLMAKIRIRYLLSILISAIFHDI